MPVTATRVESVAFFPQRLVHGRGCAISSLPRDATRFDDVGSVRSADPPPTRRRALSQTRAPNLRIPNLIGPSGNDNSGTAIRAAAVGCRRPADVVHDLC